jgi:hypothetical protein
MQLQRVRASFFHRFNRLFLSREVVHVVEPQYDLPPLFASPLFLQTSHFVSI